ncbi:MAG: glycosyltransferase family 4 protein [Flavobacteriales bacterium]|nr:glycosyltransferase family 4 protein [Flavobacteriales bacterium]
MKVLFINRSRNYGGFSVEELFQTIQVELEKKGVSVLNYEYDNNKPVKSNVDKILNYDVNVFHITSSLPNLIRYLDKNKTVFTVHDINRYLFNLKGIRKMAYKWYYLQPLKKLKYITCISNTVKEDLVKYLNIMPSRIRVIYNCYRDSYSEIKKDFNIEEPRILHIGTKPWKNLDRLVIAIKDLNVKLVVIGKLNHVHNDLLKSNNIKYENYSNLTYDEITKQYEMADIVSFISLYEGFGMPIIEAQSLGKALLTSNVSSMPEVSGDGAILINPYEVNSIKEGLLLLINSASTRERLYEKGKINIKRFDPTMIGEEYFSLYQEMIN